MAKVTSWGFTRLRGKVKEAEFRERKNKVIELSKKRVPSNPRTDAQKTIRNAYGKCVEKWNKLSYDEKLSWRTIGNSLKMSGYNAFMRQCISGMIGAIWYELTIDNTGNSNTLTDYQVLLNVSGDATFFEDCENNQVYLEFYDEDQATLLKHWVEEWDTTNHNARIWIKVPSIPGSGTKTIYLKINKGRTEDLSNPENVFDFYDDFIGDAINTDKWGGNIASFSISNSIINCPSSQKWIYSKTFQISDGILEAKVKIDSGARGSTSARTNQTDTFDPSTVESYNMNCRYPNGDVRSRKWYGGSETVLNTSSYSHDTEWHIARLILNGPEITFEYEKLDGSNKYSYSTTDTALTSGYIGLATDMIDNGSVYYDWVRVRKYASPEPSVSYTKM